MKRRVFGLIGIVLLVLLLPLIFAVDADSYESDNTWQTANAILTNGSRQTHTFNTSSDVDYIKFTAVAGVQYIIETFNQTALDTEIYFYSADGTTQLDYNDDIELGYQRNARIVFDCTTNGTYYAAISELYSNTGNYTISVLEQGRLISSLITHISAVNVTKNSVFSFTSSLQCLSADCYNVTATLDPEIKTIKENKIIKEKAENKIHSMLEEQNNVDVIVIMKQKTEKSDKKKAAFSSAQYSSLSNKGFEKKHEYTSFNGFSGKITRDSLAELESNPDVEAIYFDREVHAFLDVSIPQINADKAWATQVNGVNITGIGETICILDTGINYSHVDFGGYNYFPNSKVVGGYDFCGNSGPCGSTADDADPYDNQGHGSHVAGIVASEDSVYRGVAPSARIAAVKVLNSSGSGSESDIILGIEWCIDNAIALNISAISMSLGGSSVYSYHCPNQAEKSAIDSAVAAGIPVFVASGNVGYTNQISNPACIENATSIGAVTDADSIVYDRARILDLVAPGVSITSTDYDGTYVPYSGTSMSTPHAAALALLLKQYAKLKFARNLTAEQIKHNMVTSGLMVYDSSSKLSFPRIDALNGINSKGIIPTTVGAKPFYSLTPNPHNASCLAHITQGETCNTTWEVNVTGDANDIYAFFVIYTTDYKRNDSAKVNLTIIYNVVNLIAPVNNKFTNQTSFDFNCSVTNSTNLKNISLYGNFNNTWLLNATKNISGYENSSSWTLTLLEGDYLWNCKACNAEKCDFASSNYSLSIDNTPPSYSNLSYTALIELGDSQSISINLNDTHLSYANISYSSANYTMSNVSSNFSYSYTPLTNATINFTIYAADAAGNSNSTAGGFVINDTSEGVRIKSVSIANSTIAYGSNQTITAYIYDQWQPLTVYLDHNNTNITMPNTTIANFSYTWTVSQCGTVTYKLFANNSLGTANTSTGTFTANNCCGNGVCDGSDTCSSCTADCGACATTSSGGGGGGGGGSVSALSNYASFVVKDISPSNPAVISISNNEIPVTSVTIDVASQISQARIQVTALTEQPASVSSVESPVYRYLEITTGIQSKDVVSAEIAFNVDRSWLLENGILKDDVVLLRFNEGKWVEMPTRYLMLQNNSHYYAASVGGFSVFAISKKAAEEPEPVIEMPKTEEITASAVAVPEEKPQVKEPWYAMKAPWVSLLAVLFAACIIEAIYLSHFIHMRHKK